MIELPEANVLSQQINQVLVGKNIASAVANAHPHSFAWYTGDPADYNGKLAGKKITGANPGTVYSCGGNVEILCEDMLLAISTPIKYHAPADKLPKSHQLLLTFEDDAHMSCTVQMWGSMLCFPAGADEFPYDRGFVRNQVPSPYDDAFDEAYFTALWENANPTASAKELLATKQRIPGLGNGTLHDILWNAGIHPKRRLESFAAGEQTRLYKSLKATMLAMKEQGGRNTEKDLFGQPGGYQSVLSPKTWKNPCPRCGGTIVRQAYLGGNVYFCPQCQPMDD